MADNLSSAPVWLDWATSMDGMFQQRVRLRQHRKGYRFSIDPVLLAYFVASSGEPGSLLDLGTGCGVVPLLLAELWGRIDQTPVVTGIERQESLVALAEENVRLNQRESQVQILSHDLRQPLPGELTPEIVTFNPPYHIPAQGSLSPNPERAAARHELHGTLEELLPSLLPVLHARTRVALVYPAPGLPRLLSALAGLQLNLHRLRMVHPYVEQDASLVLVECGASNRLPSIEPPLFLYTAPREYTEEASAFLKGNWTPPQPS